MTKFLFQWIPIVVAGACLTASAQENVATQPLDVQSGAGVDVSARVAGTEPSLSGLPTLPEEGYWIDTAPINEVFQYLARSAGLQYFFNNELSAPQYNVTGHLKTDNPRQQMEELAVAFGLTLYLQKSTLSLLTEMQLSKLPVEVMSYELKYLRGAPLNRTRASSGGEGGDNSVADFEKLKSIIKPMLTHESGQIEFEEKTNTLLVSDNSVKLERVRKLLMDLDKAKPQILVNVRVLRIKRNSGRHVGLDWGKALGEEGTSITATQSLNALFNLPNFNKITGSGPRNNMSYVVDKDIDGGAGLVFGNVQVTAILRALESADLVTQEACPTIITEDNEQGIISIVDRFPIITSDITNNASGSNITDKVRYSIDEKDPSSTEEPEKSREIGVTLSVTPTLLPDGTVRMKLRPRVAKIVELVPGQTQNVYPRVSESTVEAISRIPSGQSLFLGGFYDYSATDGHNKVPVLSTIPLIKKLFSSDQKKMEQVSLVFVITPRVYDASKTNAVAAINSTAREYSGMLPQDIDQTSGLLPDASWHQGSVSEKSVQAVAPPSGSWMKRMFSRSPKTAEIEEPAYNTSSRNTGFSRR